MLVLPVFLMILELMIGRFSPSGLLILQSHHIQQIPTSFSFNSHDTGHGLDSSVAVVSVELEHEQLAQAGDDAHPGQALAVVLNHVHFPDVVIHHQVGHCHCPLLLLDAVPNTDNSLVI